jgi:hypothetical protein
MDVRLTSVHVADARLVAEGVDQPEDAMAVFVGRAGKGRLFPFAVQRSYTGAGGWYAEVLVLLSPGGEIAWRGPERRLTLRGSNKIDTFVDEVHDAYVGSSDDHELVMLFDDGRGRRLDEVARVPISILDEEPPYALSGPVSVLEEALKKSTVVWIRAVGADGTGGRAVPAWYGLVDGRVYVLTGGSEQRIPGLAEAGRAVLAARSKDQQSLVAEVEASARVVGASEPLFGRVVPVLLPRRLNLRDGEAAADRWRKECTLVELTPSPVPLDATAPGRKGYGPGAR